MENLPTSYYNCRRELELKYEEDKKFDAYYSACLDLLADYFNDLNQDIKNELVALAVYEEVEKRYLKN
jgi:hypothetical protein